MQIFYANPVIKTNEAGNCFCFEWGFTLYSPSFVFYVHLSPEQNEYLIEHSCNRVLSYPQKHYQFENFIQKVNFTFALLVFVK